MKTFSKTHLPDTVSYDGKEYYLNMAVTLAVERNGTPLRLLSDTLKKEGRRAVLVKVMSRNLKGKTDLHNRPYKPSEWVFTTETSK